MANEFEGKMVLFQPGEIAPVDGINLPSRARLLVPVVSVGEHGVTVDVAGAEFTAPKGEVILEPGTVPPETMERPAEEAGE